MKKKSVSIALVVLVIFITIPFSVFAYSNSLAGISYDVPSEYESADFNIDKELLKEKYQNKNNSLSLIMFGYQSISDLLGSSKANLNDLYEMFDQEESVDNVEIVTFSGVDYVKCSQSQNVLSHELKLYLYFSINEDYIYCFQCTNDSEAINNCAKMLNSVSYDNQPYAFNVKTDDNKSENSNSLPIVVQLVVQLLITILKYFIFPIVLSFVFKKRLNVKTALIIVILNAIFMFSLYTILSLYIAVFQDNIALNLAPMFLWSSLSFHCIKRIHSLNSKNDVITNPSDITNHNDELEKTRCCSNEPVVVSQTESIDNSIVSDLNTEQKETDNANENNDSTAEFSQKNSISKNVSNIKSLYDSLSKKEKLSNDELSFLVNDFISRSNKFIFDYEGTYEVIFNQKAGVFNGVLICDETTKTISVFEVLRAYNSKFEIELNNSKSVYYYNAMIQKKTKPIENQNSLEDKLKNIERLAMLHDNGSLSDEEYEILKKEALK